ncbi:hypothetical protein CRYUN_Cryun31cG0121900 [Craigia yunnanensis]
MQLEYKDGDEEDLMLSNEKLKFHVSHDEMERLNLSFNVNNTNDDGYDYDEMVALATSLDDCHELEPGDIICAKLISLALATMDTMAAKANLNYICFDVDTFSFSS